MIQKSFRELNREQDVSPVLLVISALFTMLCIGIAFIGILTLAYTWATN